MERINRIMFNINADVIKKILEVFSRMSALRMIAFSLCIMMLGMVYVTSDTWSAYIGSRFNSLQQNEMFKPATYQIKPQNLASINATIGQFIQQNNDMAMILVYKLVPEADAFYQGRVLVTGITSKSTNLNLEKYNLKWLPISAFRAQSNMILKGKTFIGDIGVISREYLQPDNELRDEYLTPANLLAIYNDGAKYIISIPVKTSRIDGYVSIYFKEVPQTDEEAKQYLTLAQAVAGETGYYISY